MKISTILPVLAVGSNAQLFHKEASHIHNALFGNRQGRNQPQGQQGLKAANPQPAPPASSSSDQHFEEASVGNAGVAVDVPHVNGSSSDQPLVHAEVGTKDNLAEVDVNLPHGNMPAPHANVTVPRRNPNAHLVDVNLSRGKPQQSGSVPNQARAPQQSGSVPKQARAPQQSGSVPKQARAPQQSGSVPNQARAPQQSARGPKPAVSPAPARPSPQQANDATNKPQPNAPAPRPRQRPVGSRPTSQVSSSKATPQRRQARPVSDPSNNSMSSSYRSSSNTLSSSTSRPSSNGVPQHFTTNQAFRQIPADKGFTLVGDHYYGDHFHYYSAQPQSEALSKSYEW